MGARGIGETPWVARLHQAGAHALYLHVPFCAQRCAYCDFSSWATGQGDPLMDAYVDALSVELDELAHLGLLDHCETAYVGGGTPSLLGGGLIRLVERVRSAAPQLAELTCEANPDSLSDELLPILPAAGCTRLSIGVQSLDDDELRLLGRIHGAAQAAERLGAAVASGLDVSCDLMCAIEGQTDESWARSVEGACAQGVCHVSVYPLQIEEGTPLARRLDGDEPAWNAPEVQARRMELASRLLQEAGMERYEVASHALPGHACRHNEAYWTARPYLGLGTSASGMLTREGYERLRTVAPQLPELGEDVRRVRLTCTDGPRAIAETPSFAARHFDLELLDECQAAAEDLMLAMRLTAGATSGLLAHARAVLGEERLDAARLWCERRGLARADGNSWVPTKDGWLLGNELYGRLWGLADGEVGTLRV